MNSAFSPQSPLRIERCVPRLCKYGSAGVPLELRRKGKTLKIFSFFIFLLDGKGEGLLSYRPFCAYVAQ